jgi:integrase
MATDARRHGELVTFERVRELLLDPAADADSFVVPVRTGAHASPAFKRAAGLAQFYATRAIADGTRLNYSRHWRAFLSWCILAGEDPLGGGEVVAAHLAWLATGERDEDDELALDEAGRPVQRPLTTASIDLRLAAINKAYELLAVPKPGADPWVRRVKEGIHRQLGVAPVHRKAALTLPRLKTVLEATYLPSTEAARDLSLGRLWVRLGWPAGALARCRWEQVAVTDGLVEVAPPAGARGRARFEIDGAATAPGRLLATQWRQAGGQGPLFARVRQGRPLDQPLSDAGIIKILDRLLGPGLRTDGSPEACRAALAAAERRLLEPRAIDVRDRSLLLDGFAGALRRSNLVAFSWRDITVHPEGLVVVLRRSKTDQTGRGYELFFPYGEHRLTCPVRAWLAWRDVVAEAIGADPNKAAPDTPVFCGIDRHGRLRLDEEGRLVQLRDDSFNDVVKSRCGRAGLRGDFGAHSLRAGFVTTAVDNGVELHEIAEQTNHRSIEALRVYIRRIQSAQRNPLRHFGL